MSVLRDLKFGDGKQKSLKYNVLSNFIKLQRAMVSL